MCLSLPVACVVVMYSVSRTGCVQCGMGASPFCPCTIGDCEDESSLNRDRHAPNLSFWRRISAQFDPVAVVVSIVLFFVVLFVFAVVET